ncbi:MAG: glycosyl transferase family 36 [Kosmotogaceae bacterium]
MFENEFGKFSENGKEYMVKTPKTPRPWINVISNGDYGMVISNTGSGYSWRTHASMNRITRWEQDLIKDEWGKYLFIKDNETGKFWSPTWKPVCADFDSFQVVHGTGYTIFKTEYNGIQFTTTYLVAKAQPVELWKLTIKNKTGKTRKLSIFSYLEWNLGVAPDWHREFHKCFLETEFIDNKNCIKANKRLWEVPGKEGVHWNRNWEYTAFHWVNQKTAGATASKEDFLGMYRNLSNPLALEENRLNNRFGKWEDAIASLKVDVELSPYKEKTIVFGLGATKNIEEKGFMDKLITHYSNPENVDNELKDIKKMWTELFDKTWIDTPDKGFNTIANIWLKYQAISGRIWGRTAYYQTGGAYGFRDQLQDSQIFLYLDPEKTKEQIKLHARHQFSNGRVLHWWHPLTEEGLKNEISDNLLWLPYITIEYLKNTEDFDFLSEEIEYYDKDKESLYIHCCRAIDSVLERLSSRSLPLIGAGDWNDGMNAVGIKGKGESVWLAHFLAGILKDFTHITDFINDTKHTSFYKETLQKLRESINEHAWDGEWYIRAFKDNGDPIGSSQCKDGKIFLNAQTWSILNETATEERMKIAYVSAKKHLFKKFGPILFSPAYSKPDPEIGYLTRYAPGTRENGGLYTHAGTWAVIAASKMKDEDAYEIYKSFMPVYRGYKPKEYKAEPYVTPGNVDGPDSKYFGRGGWTWYTGSATWYFVAGIMGILGIKPTWDGLLIDPDIPDSWKIVNVKRLFRNRIYDITINNKGKSYQLFVNGKERKGKEIIHERGEEPVIVEVNI